MPRIGANDFKYANDLLDPQAPYGLWPVCERYVLRGDEIVAMFAQDLDKDDDGWGFYRPLQEVPHLFFEFAQLHTAPDFEAAALAFSHEYGLPDGRDVSPPPEPGVDNELQVMVEPDKLSLSRFRAEARRAWGVLAMYEAACNRDDRVIRETLSELRDDEAFHDLYGFLRVPMARDPRLAVAAGFKISVEETQRIVNKFCRQTATFDFDPDWTPEPSNVGSGWHFHNLLGAMHLQMYLLMTSGGEVRRCEYSDCPNIISLARPKPKKRKPPKHKRFCGPACRQAHRRSLLKS